MRERISVLLLPGPAETMAEQFHEVGAVGETGEPVVEGVVGQAILEDFSLGDVEDRPGAADCAPVEIAGHLGAHLHGADHAVGPDHAMDDGVALAIRQRLIERLLDALPVVRVGPGPVDRVGDGEGTG